MRSLSFLAVLLGSVPGLAGEPPILRFELRVGAGVNVDTPERRLIPFSVGVGGEYAFEAEPWASLYGHVFVEGEQLHTGALAAGVSVRAAGGHVRLSGGGTAIVSPGALIGPTATIGGCLAAGVPSLCIDLEGSLFFLGEGVPEGGSGQVKLVLGIGFDVL